MSEWLEREDSMGLSVQVLSQEWQVIPAGGPPSCSSRQPPGNYSSFISLSLPVGHGQSEGERMVVSDFHVFIRDVLQHVDTMQKDYPGLPVFLLGHSMVSRPQKSPPKSSLVPSLAADGRCENTVMKKRGSPPHLLSALLAHPPPHALYLELPDSIVLGTNQVPRPGDSPRGSFPSGPKAPGGCLPVLPEDLWCGASWENNLFLQALLAPPCHFIVRLPRALLPAEPFLEQGWLSVGEKPRESAQTPGARSSLHSTNGSGGHSLPQGNNSFKIIQNPFRLFIVYDPLRINQVCSLNPRPAN